MDRVDLLHLEGNIIDYDVKNLILDIDNCVFNSTEWEKYIPKDRASNITDKARKIGGLSIK